MSKMRARAWSASVRCASCASTLLPMTYSSPPPDDAVDDRPHLKCPGCGLRYRWDANGRWRAIVVP